MTRPRKKTTNSRKMYKIYTKLIERLPSTYPRATLVVHINQAELIKYYWGTDGAEDPEDLERENPVQAFCDCTDNTIHVPYTLIKEDSESIVWYFLHEFGHLYAVQHYGENNPRWANFKLSEQYANRFAGRWMHKLKREGWFKRI